MDKFLVHLFSYFWSLWVLKNHKWMLAGTSGSCQVQVLCSEQLQPGLVSRALPGPALNIFKGRYSKISPGNLFHCFTTPQWKSVFLCFLIFKGNFLFQVLSIASGAATILWLQKRVWLVLLSFSPQLSGIYQQDNFQLIISCDFKFFLEPISFPFNDYCLASPSLDKFIPICKSTLIIHLVSLCRLIYRSGLSSLRFASFPSPW